MHLMYLQSLSIPACTTLPLQLSQQLFPEHIALLVHLIFVHLALIFKFVAEFEHFDFNFALSVMLKDFLVWLTLPRWEVVFGWVGGAVAGVARLEDGEIA